MVYIHGEERGLHLRFQIRERNEDAYERFRTGIRHRLCNDRHWESWASFLGNWAEFAVKISVILKPEKELSFGKVPEVNGTGGRVWAMESVLNYQADHSQANEIPAMINEPCVCVCVRPMRSLV